MKAQLGNLEEQRSRMVYGKLTSIQLEMYKTKPLTGGSNFIPTN